MEEETITNTKFNPFPSSLYPLPLLSYKKWCDIEKHKCVSIVISNGESKVFIFKSPQVCAQ